jgi:hypothetical protein
MTKNIFFLSLAALAAAACSTTVRNETPERDRAVVREETTIVQPTIERERVIERDKGTDVDIHVDRY